MFWGLGGLGKDPGVDSASFGQSFSPTRPFWTHLGSIFGPIYFSKSCWPRNLLPGDVVEIFISLIYEKLGFLVGPSLGTSPVGPVVFLMRCFF